jgi:hypothetical protein
VFWQKSGQASLDLDLGTTIDFAIEERGQEHQAGTMGPSP